MFSDPLAARAIARSIGDIAIAVDAIRGYVEGSTYEAFRDDRRTISATEREILIIAEAVARIESAEHKADIIEERRLQRRVPEVPIHMMRGMGNVIRHAYDRINVSELWTLATGSYLPDLLEALRKAYE